MSLTGWTPRKSALVLLGLMVALLACGGDAIDPAVPPAATYDVRGIVRKIDTGADSEVELSIHHEAIPDFVGIRGEIEPMDAMTMPFAVAEGLDLTGISVGDTIRFDLTVDWGASVPGQITAIERLPEETRLDLSH